VAAAKKLVERLGMEVVECVFIFDIPAFYESVGEKLGSVGRYAMVHLSEEELK